MIRVIFNCVKSNSFWLIVVTILLLEPIICCFSPTLKPINLAMLLQLVHLTVSTILFYIQFLGGYYLEFIEGDNFDLSLTFYSHLNRLIYYWLDKGEFILEFTCLLYGWALIFYRPGLAYLRLFRLFRLFWLVYFI